MSLIATTCAANINSQYQSIISPPFNYSGFSGAFATAYHDYASLGVVSGATSGGGNKSIISAAWGSTITPTTLGTALANYWATVALTPTSPNISVTNDAASRAAAFIAAVNSSIRDTESTPYFLEFIQNIEAAAKTIVWTITPPAPGSPFTSGVT